MITNMPLFSIILILSLSFFQLQSTIFKSQDNELQTHHTVSLVQTLRTYNSSYKIKKLEHIKYTQHIQHTGTGTLSVSTSNHNKVQTHIVDVNTTLRYVHSSPLPLLHHHSLHTHFPPSGKCNLDRSLPTSK